jgi:glutamate/tyrosine decarboxylase-like PLP-dependent enzyme
VAPTTVPGFLRKQISTNVSEEGKTFEEVITSIEKHILPKVLHVHSPKYFGHFSLSISDTTILAEMFSSAFHNPAYMYYLAPAYTEL